MGGRRGPALCVGNEPVHRQFLAGYNAIVGRSGPVDQETDTAEFNLVITCLTHSGWSSEREIGCSMHQVYDYRMDLRSITSGQSGRIGHKTVSIS
jgi:hypothetical protein